MYFKCFSYTLVTYKFENATKLKYSKRNDFTAKGLFDVIYKQNNWLY